MTPELTFMTKVKVKSYLKRSNSYTPPNAKFWKSIEYPIPRPGWIIGIRTLSNGIKDFLSNDEGWIYHPKEFFSAYLIVFNMQEKPIFARKEDIEICP